MKTPKGFLVLAAVATFSSCSTMKLERNEVEPVKRVAIVGFEIHQEKLKKLHESLLRLGNDSAVGGGLKPALCEKSHAATETLKDLHTTLAKEMEWSIVKVDDLPKNPRYNHEYLKRTKGFQISRLIPERFQCTVDPSTLDPISIEEMGLAGRDELMKSLRVDALATATMQIRIENKSFLKQFVGAGDYASTATAQFKLYVRGKEEPVWLDLNAKGKETEATAGSVIGIYKDSDFNEQTVLASKSAIQSIVKRFND